MYFHLPASDSFSGYWSSGFVFYIKCFIYQLQALFLVLLDSIGRLTWILQGALEEPDIHLAIAPQCGSLSKGSTPTDLNSGVEINGIQTIVSFGDSYTDGGNDDGSPLRPPILYPPSVLAGGRSANGPVWVEGVAEDINATLLSYAQWGACIDLSIWPSNPRKVDFLGQMDTFITQNHTLDPDTTLYSLFFGINDYGDSKHDGDHLTEAAHTLLEQINVLSSSPTLARNFLILDVYGQGEHAPRGESFKQVIYDGLLDFRDGPLAINFAYVDFGHIWDGVFGPDPGYEAFGFTSTDQCTYCWENCDANGWCDDPDHHFYWIPGHPSKSAHLVMADYVMQVLEVCRV